MRKDLPQVDLRTCSREECENMLLYLRGLLSQGEGDAGSLVSQISGFQKKLTQFRIANIKQMLGK